MITDLVQIRRQGEQNREENLRFRKWIKSHNYVERQFRHAAEEVHAAIDCRECAECCRVGDVPLAERDIEKLARFLRIAPHKFRQEYTVDDEENGIILKRDPKTGCVFLSGNECTVYEARPGNCDRFPHLLRGSGSIESRMWEFVDRATYCPIVFNWLAKVKALTKFR
ncbi:MAG TPA: YkgJ family cysteine cluster protein [Bryobacteraceae bacterium]